MNMRIVTMKKTLAALGACVLLAACAPKTTVSPVGTWVTDTFGTERIIEFTADGAFIDHSDGAENRYRVEGDTIVTFVEGEEASAFALPFHIDGDTLTFGGAAYTRTFG